MLFFLFLTAIGAPTPSDIADIKIWNYALTQAEVNNIHTEYPLDGLIYKYDIDSLEKYDCEEVIEEITVPNSIIPHRRIGRFECLPHKDEGLVDGKWVKGKTTARNERRYVLEMQKGSWKYKEDGIKQISYKLISTKEFTPWAKMLNVEL